MVSLTVKDKIMEKLFKQIGDEVMEYTAEDYAQREKDLIELQKQAEAVALRETAKAELLAKLGISADEAKLLLS